MTDALAPAYQSAGTTGGLHSGVAKKQDAEAIFKRIHEKGSIQVFERRRDDLVA